MNNGSVCVKGVTNSDKPTEHVSVFQLIVLVFTELNCIVLC